MYLEIGWPDFFKRGNEMIDSMDLIKELKDISLLETEDQCIKFEEIFAELYKRDDAKEYLEDLLEVFDDDVEAEEVMWSLLHYIETMPLHLLYKKILFKIEYLLNNAEYWTETIHYRMLNDDEAREVYKILFDDSNDQTKSLVKDLLNKIKNEDAVRFESKVDYVLGE
ncbi:Immunity protein 30 [Marininema mesophilum]|uniref:Immunity protein 30 n=2 Tax=Marininema mesophilum TaxID=1048340 RepID=A0A1H2YI06_9BACL|nr:Immunity protein 30 [Marininema mesophilum]